MAEPDARIRHAGAECVTICAEAGVELPLGEIASIAIDALIALESLTDDTGDDRSGPIIERIALRDEQADGAARVPQFPSRVIFVSACRNLGEPRDVRCVRLPYDRRDELIRLSLQLSRGAPLLEERHRRGRSAKLEYW